MIVNFREAVSGITHLLAALLACAGLLWLMILTRDDMLKMLSMLLYGISTIAVFVASARLHLSHGSVEHMRKLRRQDHASIYFVMAGTYTPMTLLLLDGWWRIGMLVCVWSFCLVGMYWKMKKLDGKSQTYISTFMYLLIGWFAVIAAPQWVPRLPVETVALIFFGGLVYSVGAIVFMIEKPNLGRHFGFHELWHIFVIIGSALHFMAMVQVASLV